MKWVALIAFLASIPLLVDWIKRHPSKARYVWFLFGLLPLILDPLHLIIAPVSWAYWPGYVKGAEVSLLDAVAVSILFAGGGRRPSAIFLALIAVYIVTVLISVLQADVPQASLFYAWQLLRVGVICAAAAQIARQPQGAVTVIFGMIAGLCIQAAIVLDQRASGAMQASGSYSHQNLLGMVTHFVLFPALALMLSTKRKLPIMGVAAGITVVILGASRATIGLEAAGYVALLALSILHRPTQRKSMIAAICIAMLAVAAPLASYALKERFNSAPLSEDYDERAAFERAARMMIADHPFGVGANHYVIIANIRGYSDRAGVLAISGSRSANVHNTYLLVTAETGYLGLAAFLLLLLTPVFFALRQAWRYRLDPRSAVLLGVAMTVIVVALHCLFEWVFVSYSVESLLGLDLGLVAGIAAAQTAEAKRSRRMRGAVSSPGDQNTDRNVDLPDPNDTLPQR